MELKIEKISHYFPENELTNDKMSTYMDTNDEWIVKRTGIKSRHVADNETLLDMTKKAIMNLNLSNEEIKSIEAIFVATMSHEYSTPTLSGLIQKEFDFNEEIICFDINVACTGFLYALNTAHSYIKAQEVSKKALVIGGEKMTNVVDKNDRSTAILFGDGVGCALVEASNEPHKLASYFKTTGRVDELYCLRNQYLKMQGQEVFKFAVKTIKESIEKILEQTELKIEEIDYFALHQANARILKNVARELKIPKEKIISNIEHVGNTSVGSIPILISEKIKKLKSHEKIMMVGFGAGLTSGAYLYQH